MDKKITSIALVDDHSLLRNGLAALMTSFQGYRVIFEADNGKDFIAQLEHHPAPDIVLLDITMPEMNGFETAEWIRQHNPDMRILVLSMMDNDEAIIRMLKSGARGYVLKDSKPAVFHQALDDIRDKGFFMNELVSNNLINVFQNENTPGGIVSRLTPKETRFLQLACTEMTYKEIAKEMELSPRTVEGYRDDLFKKLGVQSRVGLVLFALRQGIEKL